MDNNLEHTKGDTFFKSLAFTDSNSTAIDITGSTTTFTIKEKVSDATALIQSTATITDASGGLAEINVPGATMDIDINKYYYDIQFVDSAGTITTVLKGLFNVSYEITT